MKKQSPERGVTCPNSLFLFFFFFNFIYLLLLLFIIIIIIFWLCWVFVSAWGLSLVAASGGHSSSRCAGLSLSRPLLLRSTGSRRAGSVVVVHGLSCSAACGIFPDQGLNPCPLHWQADSQPLRHQGSPSLFLLFICLFVCLFIYILAAPGLSCSTQGLLVAAYGLLSCGMHVGSSFLTRDQTPAPCVGSVESYPLDHQGSPSLSLYSLHSERMFPWKARAPVLGSDMGQNPPPRCQHRPFLWCICTWQRPTPGQSFF